jgi:hypothetical protein
MREIKFRAWDSEFKEVLYFTLNEILQPEVRPSFMRNNVIEQFTGLHDKNGKENYESDLIKDERTNIIFEIVWNDDFAGWWCVSLDKTIEQPLCNINKYCINIGNIHENPELIK